MKIQFETCKNINFGYNRSSIRVIRSCNKFSIRDFSKSLNLSSSVDTTAINSLWAAQPSLNNLTKKNIVRAAFDLGSGDFKLFVAEMSLGKFNVKLSKAIPVNLGEDSNQNRGTLSDAVQVKALTTFRNLYSLAERHGATTFSAIATAVFRDATNGPKLLKILKESCKMPLRGLSQKEEGRLGFLTGISIFPHILVKDLLLLDVGSSSVQITGNAKEEFYGADVGISKMAQIFAECVRLQKYTKSMIFNNITFNEVLQLSELTMGKIPKSDWILERIRFSKARISYFDYSFVINTIGQLTDKKHHLHITELEKGLRKLVDYNFDSEDITPETRQYILFCLTLVYSLMKKLGFKEINLAINEVGNSPGLALAEEFWSESEMNNGIVVSV